MSALTSILLAVLVHIKVLQVLSSVLCQNIDVLVIYAGTLMTEQAVDCRLPDDKHFLIMLAG